MSDDREFYVRNYLKEEEFLEHYSDSAFVASRHLAGEWRPNPRANDSTRHNHRYFLSTGELTTLAFCSGTVYHDAENRFSSVQILLESSKRVVNVRVRWQGDELVAETIIDKAPTR